ncbi:MAG: Uma2 family endonuclease, partial [Gloeomargarita sp. SKYG98]|nr:Uma2 family endonuclease [Gloeomargarita sp. SKYG98]
LLLRLDETCGGQSRISADDYVEGPPELIAEIATSSAAYDLHDKKEVYRRCGVKEYLVWIPVEGTLQWFGLENAMYVCKEPDAQGVIKSRVFPGLWLAVTALTARDMVVVLQVLQMGLQSPEHRAFVDALGQYQCSHST